MIKKYILDTILFGIIISLIDGVWLKYVMSGIYKKWFTSPVVVTVVTVVAVIRV